VTRLEITTKEDGTLTKQSIVASGLAVAALAAGVIVASGPPAVAQGGGTIVGEVKLVGAAPAPKTVKVNKDNEVCGQEKKIAEVQVGANGGVGSSIVSVGGAKGAKAAPAVLDQKGCEFRPNVVVMAPGELKVLNSDGVLHNIHTFSTVNPPVNKAQPKFKKEMEVKLEKPELIKVVCDAHSWMLGWIYVTENPTAVTDGNGAFKLENVPPGKHKVEVVHPVLGKQTKEVEVKAGAETKVAFELKK
jgi:plastocyanin